MQLARSTARPRSSGMALHLASSAAASWRFCATFWDLLVDRDAVRVVPLGVGMRVCGLVHGGLPRLTSFGLAAAPVDAPAPPPTRAPITMPGGPASAPIPAPVAAPAAPPPLARSDVVEPQAATVASDPMVTAITAYLIIARCPFGHSPVLQPYGNVRASARLLSHPRALRMMT